MPVGGQSSFYTDWYQPACGKAGCQTYKWETFLTAELPQWLSAEQGCVHHRQRRRRPVDVGQLGDDPLGLPPQMFIYAGSLSAFLNPSEGQWPFLINMAMGDAGGYEADRHVGSDRRPNRRGSATTRWCRSPRWWPTTPASGCTAATARPTSSVAPTCPRTFLEGLTIRTNSTFRDNYIAAGGKNAVFNFPAYGTHSWEYWGAQLQADEARPDLHLGS